MSLQKGDRVTVSLRGGATQMGVVVGGTGPYWRVRLDSALPGDWSYADGWSYHESELRPHDGSQ